MPLLKSFFGRGLFCAILLSLASAANAQHFTGQTVSIVVNYPPGGPTDVEARIIAQYLPKYLPGVSSVIVRNVPGGGGNIGVNQIGEAQGKDRYNISFFTWNPMDQIIKSPILHVRYNDLKLIAGMRQTTLLYIRRDAGITQPADIAKIKPFKDGSLAPASHGTLRQRLALDLLGAKHETIPGYKGLHEIEMAVRQGDLQLTNNSLPGYITSVKPLLVDTGFAMPLLQYDRSDGLPGRSADLPDVPTFTDVYKAVYGKDAMPSGPKWQLLQFLTRMMDTMYRAVFMPPSAPAPAVDEMRAAFDKLQRDPEFLAAYEKIVMTKPHFVLGAEGERLIAELGNVDPAMVQFMTQYIDSGK